MTDDEPSNPPPPGRPTVMGTRTATPHASSHDHIHPRPSNPLFRYVFSTDHKVIGIQFLFSGLIFFVLGGLLAMAIRWQLAWPWLADADPGQGRSGPSRASGCRRSSIINCSRCTGR